MLPLPLIILAASGIAGAAGVASGVNGAVKMGNAKDQMDEINAKHNKNIEMFRVQNVETCGITDRLGILQLTVLKSFDDFSRIFTKLRDKPEFKHEFASGASLPAFEPDEIKNASIGAAILLNGLGAGMAGAAGGFAAAGTVSAAAASFGMSSTGVAIATLKGGAAINATLAYLGGGSIAAGGGGMALGQIVLNSALPGVGLLIGGIIFNVSASSLSKKVDEAWEQIYTETASVDKICGYLRTLSEAASKYYDALSRVRDLYNRQFHKLRHTVNVLGKTEHSDFTDEESLNLQNAILLVQLLHEMCKVNLVIYNEKEDDINTVNQSGIDDSIENSKIILKGLPSRACDDDSYTSSPHASDIYMNSLTAEADALLDQY